MTITKETKDTTLIVKVSGRIDTTTSPDLEAELKSSLDGVETLIFDFQDVEYISSAGLRVLLFAQKTMNKQGSMKLICVRSEIMEIFEVTGFTDILTIG